MKSRRCGGGRGISEGANTSLVLGPTQGRARRPRFQADNSQTLGLWDVLQHCDPAYPYNNVRREAWPTRKVAHEIRENTKSVEDKQNPGTVTGVKPGEDDPGTAVEV